MIRKLSMLILAVGILVAANSCKKESDITITFEEPTNEQTVSDPSDVHVHIKVESSEEFDKLKVKLKVDGESDMIAPLNPYEHHVHGKEYDFEQDLDLSSYPSGTEFHLEVEIYEDHDGEELAKSESIHFKI